MGKRKILISPPLEEIGAGKFFSCMGNYRAHTKVIFLTPKVHVGWGRKVLKNFPFSMCQMRRAADLRNCR